MVARLFDHYHITFEQYARLTDWQIREIYCHTRSRQGFLKIENDEEADFALIMPKMTATLEDELKNLKLLCESFKMDPEAIEKAREDLKRKFADGGPKQPGDGHA